MPSTSPKQAKLMRAVAHGWKPDRIKGPSRAVATEFMEADRKYSGGFAESRYAEGGEVTVDLQRQLDAMINQPPAIAGTKSVGDKLAADFYRNYTTAEEAQEEETQLPMPTAEELGRIGVNDAGESIFEDDEAAAQAAFQSLPPEQQQKLMLPSGVMSDADRAAVPGMYEGGLAPMNDIIQRGFAPSLHMQGGGEVWTPYGPGQDYGDIPAETLKFLGSTFKGSGYMSKMMRKLQEKARVQYGYNPPAVAAPTAVPTATPVTTVRPRGGSGRRGRNGGGRRERDGGGGGGAGPPGPSAGPPPADVPPVVPIPPRDRRAGRDTEYSEALRAHRARIAASLAVPPGGYAGGGQVNYYQEGGEALARPGHAEVPANPYVKADQPGLYGMWERKYHKDPAPPPPPPEVEELSWLDRLMGKQEASVSRTEEELAAMGEGMEEAYGGYIDAPGYQFGGLAAAQSPFRGPPRGGVPPRVGMRNPRGGIPPGGAGGRSGMLSRMMRQAQSQRGGMPRGGVMGPAGSPQRGGLGQMVGRMRGQQPAQRPGIVPGRGFLGQNMGRLGPQPGGFPPGKGPRPMVPPSRGDPRAMPPQGGAGPGIPGGPRVPPNQRGFLQKQRMMNRPPANVGGGANRVGMQDQQGGLARALQRGTGRPPMSRRGGFGRAR